MRGLLDTHVLLWWLADDERLGPSHRTIIAEPANQILVSAVSVAEIAIKTSIGKLTAPVLDGTVLEEAGFHALDLTTAHAALLRDLPWHHRDPFDRLLVAQARAENVPILTADARLAQYDVETL